MNFNPDVTSFDQLNAIYDARFGDLKAHAEYGLPAFHDPIVNQLVSLRPLEPQMWDQKEALSTLAEFDGTLKRLKAEGLPGGGRTSEVGWAFFDASVNALANAMGYFVGYVVAVKVEELYDRNPADLSYWQRFASEMANRLVQQSIRWMLRDLLWPACQRSIGIHAVSLEKASKGRQWGQLGIATGATVGGDMLGAFLYDLLPQPSGPDALVQGAARTLVFAVTDSLALWVRSITARTSKSARCVVPENFHEGACVSAGIRGVQVALDSFFLALYKLHCSNLYGFVALLDACELTPYLLWEGGRLCRATSGEQPVPIELRPAQGGEGHRRDQPSQADVSRVSRVSERSRLSRINMP
jgi:hypothetical protein